MNFIRVAQAWSLHPCCTLVAHPSLFPPASCRRRLPSRRCRHPLCCERGVFVARSQSFPNWQRSGMNCPLREPSFLHSRRRTVWGAQTRRLALRGLEVAVLDPSPKDGSSETSLLKLQTKSLLLRNSAKPVPEASWHGLAVPMLSYAPEPGSSIQTAFWEWSLAGASSQTVLGKHLKSSSGPKLWQDHPNNKKGCPGNVYQHRYHHWLHPSKPLQTPRSPYP